MNRRSLLLAAILGASLSPARGLRAQAADSTLTITNVSVIEPGSRAAPRVQAVVLRGNRIVELASPARLRPPAGARVIDGTGRFLIPGLWDLHVHLGSAGEASLPLFIASGVTGVRDMGTEQFEPLRQWRVEILAGKRVGPRIVAAGPIVDGPTPNWPLRVTVRNDQEARRAIDSLATVGVDFIKVHQQLERGVYFSVASEARRLDLPFAGHVPPTVSGIEAARAGQRSLEHMTGVPSPTDSSWRSTIAAFRRNDTWIDPTLSVYWVLAHREDSSVVNDRRIPLISPTLRKFWDDQKVGWSGDMSIPAMRRTYEAMKAGVRALNRDGVHLLTGTDLGFIYVYPGSGVIEELEHLVEAGLTPSEALRAGTINPARYFGKDRELGTVEAGKLADLVLLDANPLTAIGNLRKIRAVIANGRYFDADELRRLTADSGGRR